MMEEPHVIDWEGMGRSYGADMFTRIRRNLERARDNGVLTDATGEAFADIVTMAILDQQADLLRIGIAPADAAAWAAAALKVISDSAARESWIAHECARTVELAKAPPKNRRH